MNDQKDYNTFISELTNTFPEIREEVLDNDNSGILTLQVGCFKRFTQKAIDAGDIETVKKCFQFVESNLDRVEHKIENALVISYMGKLNITKSRKIENLLSKKLKDLLTGLDKYYSTQPQNKKLNDFLNNL